METATQQTATNARIDVHTLINDKVIEQLRKGSVPWHHLWTSAGQPTNAVTKKPYFGLNALLLGMEGYEHNLFLTFDQVHSLKGKVMRGAKGHSIIHWSKPKPTEGQDQQGSAEQKSILKYYTVFNIAQCEKLPESLLSAANQPAAPLSFESIVKAMPNAPKIKHKESKAYYDVVEDFINMPKMKSVKDETAYYALLLHQLVHSTGHDTRLARKGVVEMPEVVDGIVSKEELVAEIATCFLLSWAGALYEFKHDPECIQQWLSKLQQDKLLIFKAAGEAQAAVNYILNLTVPLENPKED